MDLKFAKWEVRGYPIGDIRWRTDEIASEWQARREQEPGHRERQCDGGERRAWTTIGDSVQHMEVTAEVL